MDLEQQQSLRNPENTYYCICKGVLKCISQNKKDDVTTFFQNIFASYVFILLHKVTSIHCCLLQVLFDKGKEQVAVDDVICELWDKKIKEMYKIECEQLFFDI